MFEKDENYYNKINFERKLEEMLNKDHVNFVKALMSVLLECSDKEIINKLYEEYMENDMITTILNETIVAEYLDLTEDY